MIKAEKDIFQLHTDNTSYVFRLMPTGHLEHLYYGPYLGRISAAEAEAMTQKVPCPVGNILSYDKNHINITPENICLEISGPGKGDLREPSVELIHYDGERTCDFVFDSAQILSSNPDNGPLPASYGLNDSSHLCVVLKEERYRLFLELHYHVYEECDVITRSAKLINRSENPVHIKRLMSATIDLPDSGYVITSFTGAWAREMEKKQVVLNAGTFSVSSVNGLSSNRANPFIMAGRQNASEDYGECIGINLIYSGNHYEAVQVGAFGKTRIINGINPASFDWCLGPEESFNTPESVISFSSCGYSALSLNMHGFIREHVIRGKWKNRPRPVLVNSWEAFYFNFNEKRLLKLARVAKDIGAELFVLDDGWFANRNDDTSSLGDWYVNKKKLPSGLKGLSEKIRAMGLDFGIWVEPEAVNTDSDLYRLHPEWTMGLPDGQQAEGRNERCLDLANTEVVDYLIKTFTEVFSSAEISYVKWDLNSFFSDVYSPFLSPERQGETAHRYVLGLYRLMDNLAKAFPEILFEGCAAGGGRFDLGILSYFPQIWGSDNTDPVSRLKIQEGYSFGYPLSCVGAHVSASPNHQTLRATSPETRFNTAAFGILGYELNLPDMKKDELSEIKKQIRLYKKWRDVLQTGNFYRLESGNIHSWICVSKDRTKAVGMMAQELVRPCEQYACFKAAGLKKEAKYHFFNIPGVVDIKTFGSLANAVSPVHIKEGSLMQNAVSKRVKLPGESEDYTVSGALLMNCGIKLKGAFTATGYSEDVRCFKDFSSRMYFMEEI